MVQLSKKFVVGLLLFLLLQLWSSATLCVLISALCQTSGVLLPHWVFFFFKLRWPKHVTEYISNNIHIMEREHIITVWKHFIFDIQRDSDALFALHTSTVGERLPLPTERPSKVVCCGFWVGRCFYFEVYLSGSPVPVASSKIKSARDQRIEGTWAFKVQMIFDSSQHTHVKVTIVLFPKATRGRTLQRVRMCSFSVSYLRVSHSN